MSHLLCGAAVESADLDRSLRRRLRGRRASRLPLADTLARRLRAALAAADTKSVRSFRTKANVALAKLDDLDLVNVTTKGQTGKTLHFYATDIDKRLCP